MTRLGHPRSCFSRSWWLSPPPLLSNTAPPQASYRTTQTSTCFIACRSGPVPILQYQSTITETPHSIALHPSAKLLTKFGILCRERIGITSPAADNNFRTHSYSPQQNRILVASQGLRIICSPYSPALAENSPYLKKDSFRWRPYLQEHSIWIALASKAHIREAIPRPEKFLNLKTRQSIIFQLRQSQHIRHGN